MVPVALVELLASKETFRGACPAAVDVDITAVGGEVCDEDPAPVSAGLAKAKGADFGLSVPFVKVAASEKLVMSAERDTVQPIEVALATWVWQANWFSRYSLKPLTAKPLGAVYAPHST